MSAFGGRADIGQTSRNVRFRPKADMAALRLGVTKGTIRSGRCDILFMPDAVLGAGPGWRLCRQHSQGSQACGLSGRADEQVRASYQRRDGQDARPHRAALPTRHLRRGDRLRRHCCICSRPLLAQSGGLPRRIKSVAIGAKRTCVAAAPRPARALLTICGIHVFEILAVHLDPKSPHSVG